ncbi:flavin reductase family protein [Chitinilyticum piscinae]|uniref:Flavin reductase family protein n=1 Tax=Chitinilyticum piscinae TaxID=2866724 RepID=A0A8J7K190_9NEIS|nr:flavin reductase family protein [Chitinilyticum piscinae]MBE9608876.1 flavin reductase family protein [Chitinilyticum piscinae]
MAALTPNEKYTLLSDAVVPRPIAWVSTVSTTGVVNVAPFSWFNMVTDDPPLVAISINRGRDGQAKDTARNLLEQGECVIHLPSRSDVAQVAASGRNFAPHESEAELLGLALAPAQSVTPPRLADAVLALEGRLWRHIPIEAPGQPGQVIADHCLIEIVHAFAADSILQDGRIHPDPFNPLMRLGGMDYASIGERFDAPRR